MPIAAMFTFHVYGICKKAFGYQVTGGLKSIGTILKNGCVMKHPYFNAPPLAAFFS